MPFTVSHVIRNNLFIEHGESDFLAVYNHPLSWLRRPYTTLIAHYNPIGMTTTSQRTSTSPTGRAAVLAKNDNDVVIVAAVRSAMTKVSLGALSSSFFS